ncbi:MAG TPA: chromosomal replication initiator protein DnaA [Candidatus Wujingus californicus]|uniref:chromosomal replication initiator protein DnaA n=1 Tax=Candidatus Wujingus californicus TaxID=3367618 RepID=UPI001D4631C8|nr:chromosomal replication initiator protein DnaA [Planctomycetota bacterium]
MLSSPGTHTTTRGFVVGHHNRIAYAASLAITENPGNIYNPLFLYGPDGAGKTELLKIVKDLIIKNHGGNVVLVNCGQFINHYVESVRNNSVEDFRTFYDTADALLLDDIQKLEAVRGCREAFFFIFNKLFNIKKQIVITSNCAPEEFSTFEDRLTSRFSWGLVCSVGIPDYETKIAIIENKAGCLGLKLTRDVSSYIADTILDDFRDIENVLKTILKESKDGKSSVSVDFAKKIIRGKSSNKRIVSVDAILKTVSVRFDVSVSQILSKCRSREVVLPRQIVMYLSKRLTNMSLSEIGGYIGGRDHATVIHANRKISKLVKRDRNVLLTIKKLENEL